MRSRALTAAFVLVAALAPVTATAAEPEWLAGSPSARVRAEIGARAKARAYLDERAAELDAVAIEWLEDKEISTADGRSIVRLQQSVDGVPVLGKGAVVRVGRSGDVSGLVLSVARDLTVSTVPTLSASDAAAALGAIFGSPMVAERASLVVSPLGAGALLWQLDVRDAPGGSRYWVDAHTGELFAQRSLAVHALGRVYTMNSLETPTPADVELLELDVASDPIHLNGWGGLLTVTNYVGGTSQGGFELEQTLVPSSGQDFLYDPPALATDPTDAFAQVNLYHHITSMKTFASHLGVSIDQPSWKLTAVANALEDGQPLDNAFFSPMGQDGTFAAPNLIAIGQGSQNDFAYDSDVFKHEFGHYLTDNAIGYNMSQLFFNEYGLSPHSGSIDEGIADYLACSDNDDAELGEASLQSLGGLRDLTDTSKKCPEDIMGEVHEDGEIAGSLAWSVRELLGKELGDQVVWGAVSTLPTGGASFGDLGRGLITTAQELETDGQLNAMQVSQIQELVAERGLDACDHVIPLDAGESKTINVLGLDLLGQLFGASCAALQSQDFQFQGLFHFSHQPDASSSVLRFQVDATPTMGSGAPQFSIYARKGQHVGLSGGGGFSLPTPVDFDLQADVDAASGELVIEGAALDPSAEYFFLIMNRGCPSLSLSVTTSTDPISTTTSSSSSTSGGGTTTSTTGAGGSGGGDGADDDEEDDDGCDCRSAGTEGNSRSAAALALLGLAALGRRRRTR